MQLVSRTLAFDSIKAEYDSKRAWGLSMALDIQKCNPDLITDPQAIKQYVINLCELIDMNRYGEPMIVKFGECPKVAGYSLVQLIETSCVTAHFSDLTNSAYIDIFSCKLYDPHAVQKFSEDFFGGKRSTLSFLYRL